MEAKITVKLWESEIQAGAFCDQVNQIYSKNVWGGGGLSPTFARFSVLLCIWNNEHY